MPASGGRLRLRALSPQSEFRTRGRPRRPSPKEDCLSDWAWGPRRGPKREVSVPAERQACPDVLGPRPKIVRSYPEIGAPPNKTPGRVFSCARKPITTNDFRRRASRKWRLARARWPQTGGYPCVWGHPPLERGRKISSRRNKWGPDKCRSPTKKPATGKITRRTRPA